MQEGNVSTEGREAVFSAKVVGFEPKPSGGTLMGFASIVVAVDGRELFTLRKCPVLANGARRIVSVPCYPTGDKRWEPNLEFIDPANQQAFDLQTEVSLRRFLEAVA